PVTYSFNVQPVVDGQAPIGLNTTVNGSIGVTGERDFYTLVLPGATQVLFDSLTNNTQISWSLDGPRGNEVNARTLAFSDGNNTSTNSVLSLPAGTYTLTVDGTNPIDATGSYSFRLLDLSTAATLTLGTPVVNQALTPSNGTDLYKFTAAANQEFFFNSQGVTGTGSAFWKLIDPFGNLVFAATNLATDVDSMTLAQPGTYTLLVEGSVVNTAALTYPFNVQPVVDGQATIGLNSTVNGSIGVAGERDFYTLVLPSATQLVFDSLANNSQISWSLDGPRGNEASGRAFAFSDGNNTTSNTVLSLPAGTYTLTGDGTNPIDATGSDNLPPLRPSTATAPAAGAAGDDLTP